MATKRFVTTVAIGATVENLLSGLSFEFPEANVNVVIAATQPLAPNDLDIQVQFGSELVMERSAVAVEEGVGRGPIIPQNVVLSTPSIAGRRLAITAFNNDAAATSDITIFIETTPL